MDLLSVGIGAIIGIIVTMLMVEIGMKKVLPWSETSRLTSIWSLEDIKGSKPLLIVAENIEDLEIPEGSLVALKEDKKFHYKSKVLVKTNLSINTNFVVGEDRALIFSSWLKPGIPVIWSTNPKIIARLTSDFNRYWSEAK
jgi:hypothetical protein